MVLPKKYKSLKKKRRDETSLPPSPFRRREVTPEQKKEYLKLFIFLLLWSLLLTAIYMTCIRLEFEPIMLIYTAAGGILFLVWLIFNGGVRKIDISKYEKPPEMGYDEFHSFTEKLRERQKRAKIWMVLYMPFLFILAIDYIIIIWSSKK